MTRTPREGPRSGRTSPERGRGRRLRAWLFLAALAVLLVAALAGLRETLPGGRRPARSVELDAAGRSTQDLARMRLDGNRDFLVLLARELADDGPDGEAFQARASAWVASHPELRNVTLVGADFVIRDVSPRAGNAQILGLRVELPEPARASARARADRAPVYTLPFEAIQGRPSFEIWVPIHRGEEFLGLLAGVYSCVGLLEEVVPDHLRQAARVSLVGPAGGVLAATPGPSDVDPLFRVDIPLSPPGGGVRLLLEGRREPGLPAVARLLIFLCALLGAGIVVLLGLLVRGSIRRRRAEEALSAQEDRFRLLRGQARDVLLFLDQEGRIADANRAAEATYGFTGAELSERTLFDLGPESEEAASRALFEEARTGDARAEAVHRRSDGSTFPAEVRIHGVTKAGPPVFLAVVRDITERKEAEARLLQANRRLRTISEISQLVVRERDRQALLEGACRILVEHGRFRTAWIDLADARGAAVTPAARCGEDGEEPGRTHPEATFPLRVGDGVGALIGVRAASPGDLGMEETSLLEGLAADLGHALEAIDDGEARRLAERELRQERDLLLRIAETSPVAITRIDDEGRIVFANRRAEEILGLSKDGIAGRTYDAPDWRITALDGGPFADDDLPVRRVLASKKAVFDVRHSISRPGGQRRHLSVNAAPIADETGRISGVVATVEDVTERLRAEAALREEEERLRFSLETLGAGLWDLDLATHAAYRTLRHDQIFGYEELLPEWSYERFLEHVLPEDREEVDRKFRVAIDSRSTWDFECRIARSDGPVAWIRAVGGHRLDAKGVPARMVGIVLDVSGPKRAEAALLASEERLRFALDGADDGLWDVQLETGEVYVSPRGCEILGYGPDELGEVVKAWHELVSPEDMPRTRAALDDYLAGRSSVFSVEQRLRTKSGGWKWILSRGKVVGRDASGRPLRMAGTHKDISERKRTEEALYASEARFREMLENVELIALTLDARGVVTFCNDHLLRLTGWTREEIVGQEWFGRFLPESDPTTPRVFHDNVLHGRIPSHHENPIRTKGGETREILWSSTILKDPAGRPVGTASIGEDVTDRRRAEREVHQLNRDLEARVAERTARLAEVNEELQRSAAEIRDLYDHAPCGYHSLDEKGRFLQMNATELAWLGYGREEVIGKLGMEDLLTAEGIETFRRTFVRFKRDGEAHDVVVDLRRKDGSTFPVLLSATAVTDASGRFLHSRSTLFDITERRKAELRISEYTAQLQTANRHLQNALDKAESAERVKSAFLAAMSHELRTPLNSVIGFTGALLGGLVGPVSDEQREALEIVQRNGRHLLDLINDVLDLSKIEAGEMRLSHQAFDLCRVAREAVLALGPQAESRGLRLLLEPGPETLPLHGDPRRTAQVLLNLLSNAVKFTDQGEVAVRVFASEDGRRGAVAVRDTGPGILRADLDGIFREFVQLDSGTARVQEGTGLGLALSRKLARLMGGDVAVESTRGAGSTFTFWLPLPGGGP